tara:strand:- start:420 stop:1010 length:591 start_codon:yes stop_codon:yes gene_type:complete
MAGAALIWLGGAAGSPASAQDALSPFIGTIRYFGFNFAPQNWAHCDGQLLAISQFPTLYSLLGTTYGGDGRVTFGLPDMRGRFPIHYGQGPGLSDRRLGQIGGAEQVTLNANQIGHRHTLRASTMTGNQSDPTGHTLAQDTDDTPYLVAAPDTQMHAGSVTTTTTPAAGGQPHNNMAPFLGVYCNIALDGIFPSRS